MFNLFGSSNSVLGVDVGTADLKIVQVSHTPEGPTLDTYGFVNLSGQLEGQSPEKTLEITADVLLTLIKRAKARAKNCVISLPSSAVFTSLIDLPEMAEKELGGAIAFEAKKYIPLSIDEVILSWSIVSKSEGRQSVLLTAVPKQIKDRYVKLFELAGLDLDVIEIEALALIRSLIGEQQNNCVIIDIGAKSTSVNLIKSGFLQLSRSVSVGGDTITDRLAATLGVTTSRAEQFKQDMGLAGSPFLPETLKPVLSSIKSEVKQLLTIYRSRGLVLDKVVITGGGAGLPQTIDFFSDLGTPVEYGNPLQYIKYPSNLEDILHRHSTRLAVAIGLALRK